MIYQFKVSGLETRIRFRYPDTPRVFQGFIQDVEACDSADQIACGSEKNSKRKMEVFPETLTASEEVLKSYLEDYRTTPWRAEADAFIPVISDWLLPEGCIFHAASFRWRDGAYLLTGLSGVGKSTQLRNWKKLYPDEVEIINGDKPALRFDSQGRLIVYPSPWNGKENFRGDCSAPLQGIICLKQGPENVVYKAEKKELIPFLYQQVFSLTKDEETVRQVADFLEHLLISTDIWMLENTGDDDSTIMMHDAIIDRIKDHEDII